MGVKKMVEVGAVRCGTRASLICNIGSCITTETDDEGS